MDSIYASPEDFKSMEQRNRIRGIHLLEYFVNRCHEIGVIAFLFNMLLLFFIHSFLLNV